MSFTWQHTEYKIKIAGASIYPQGYAAVSQFATKMDGVNLVADIGNGTMNVLYVINGRPQSERMYTEKFGTHFCTVDIREAFLRKTQREINEHIIDEVLCKGTANIVQSDMKIIKAEVQKYVSEIFHRLRDHGYDENTMMLYITGGGGCLVNYAFQSAYSLDRVVLPSTMTAIADYAFYYASSLDEVVIPEGVVSIGASAFTNCTALAGITLPDSLTTIGTSAFHSCKNLSSVTFGSGLTSIG